MQGCLVPVLGKMPVNAIITYIELATDKPFPQGRITGIQYSIPGLVPVQHIGILCEALRKIVQAEPVIN